MVSQSFQQATFAGGCFWCTEAIFKRLKGVTEVISGYAGGKRENPSYEQVSTGATGHVEAIQITFDPTVISYETLLNIFWHLHDPTTRNRQGNDVGTQYRSVIFYHDDTQKQLAEQSKKALEESHYYTDPILTEIVSFENFYTAEDYHQNYYDTTPSNPYCNIIIAPKIKKLLQMYGKEVKDEYKN
jgi:peptide-methionine (S)-S-oxide reductase